MQEEIWKVYKKTSTRLYEVSSEGNAKINGVLVDWSKRETNGYYTIGRKHVHRIIAELFIPNPENKPQVDHINTNKHDNRACNLRWVTNKENHNNPLTKKQKSYIIKTSYTEEHKKRLSDLLSNTKYMNDGYNEVKIRPEYWGEFIDIGYKFGRI